MRTCGEQLTRPFRFDFFSTDWKLKDKDHIHFDQERRKSQEAVSL